MPADSRRSPDAVLPTAVSPSGEGLPVLVGEVRVDGEHVRRPAARGTASGTPLRASCVRFCHSRSVAKTSAAAGFGVVDAVGHAPAGMRHRTASHAQASDLESAPSGTRRTRSRAIICFQDDRPVRRREQSRHGVANAPVGEGRSHELERPVRPVEQGVHRQPGHVVEVVMREQRRSPRPVPSRPSCFATASHAGAGVEHQSLAARPDEQQGGRVAAELVEAAAGGRPAAPHSTDEKSQAHFSVNPHTPSHDDRGMGRQVRAALNVALRRRIVGQLLEDLLRPGEVAFAWKRVCPAANVSQPAGAASAANPVNSYTGTAVFRPTTRRSASLRPRNSDDAFSHVFPETMVSVPKALLAPSRRAARFAASPRIV